MSDIPSENHLKQEPASDGEGGERAKNNQDRPPAIDLAALIDTIKNEGATYRKEEQREDRGKASRERITIGLLFCTVIAIGWQVYEMVRVYGPVKEQAEASVRQAINSDKALVEAQRAWVGPQNAAITAELAIGKPIEVTITYQNTGREPALGFVYIVDTFSVTIADDKKGVTAQRSAIGMSQCKSDNKWQGGSVVYPATGFSSYSLFSKTKDDFVDDPLIKGDKIFIVQGCFLYRTFDTPHHSYFCYFYKTGLSKIQNLNICPGGHDAD